MIIDLVVTLVPPSVASSAYDRRINAKGALQRRTRVERTPIGTSRFSDGSAIAPREVRAAIAALAASPRASAGEWYERRQKGAERPRPHVRDRALDHSRWGHAARTRRRRTRASGSARRRGVRH